MMLILCLKYYPGEEMPIEHDVDREDTIEDVDADNGDEMEKTPEAGQSRRRAPVVGVSAGDHLSIYLYISISVYLSLSIYLCLSLSIFLYLSPTLYCAPTCSSSSL